MRDDTKQIADELDAAADLVERGDLPAAQKLIGTILTLITQWVERHLSP